MHLSFGLLRPEKRGRSALAAFVLLLGAGAAVAEDGGRLLPRARSDPVTLPIHTLHARSPADNTTFGGGLSSVTLTSDRQSYYTVIKVGALNFRVALDTASADLWLVSTGCETESCKKVPRYPLTYQSSTFVSLDGNATEFSAKYADGTAISGFVAAETIGVTNLTLPNQTFAVITNSNVSLVDQSSGIMGLGFPRLSSISSPSFNSTPFFATLAREGRLEYPLFGLSLTNNFTGALTLGAIDSAVVANISHIGWNKVAEFSPFAAESNVSSYLQWAIPITGISVNGSQLTPVPTYPNINRNSLALFDIGAPGIYGPYQDVSRIYSMIDGARLVDTNGQWIVPCDTTVPMAFTFGQRNYTITPTDYIIGPASGNPNLCLSWPMSLPPSSDGIDWQIGAAFLRTVYSIFSFGINAKEPPLIGLYPLQNATNSTQPQTPDAIASFISANSETVTTTLPNFILPTPTFTTPPYALNTSVSTTLGGILTSGLANGTYSALFGQKTTLANTTAMPMITPPPTVVTLVVTDAGGDVSTTTSSRVMMSVTLGLPSANGAVSMPIPPMMQALSCILIVWATLFVQTY
ncbi:acid protease [Pholiota conissans]|uniref:Acid protease n=1 Tax=Pholiota conissans TaxID=109636 RepID=A0A9P6CZ26_9AGAR|nr:acid protease [Pholiota conissans]